MDCKKLGAEHFILSTDESQMKAASRTLDAIICTVDVDLNWSSYFELIKPDGKLIFVGLPNEKLAIR